MVGEAADGAEALAVCTREQPDVVCMDVRMPGMDGIAATRRLMQQPHPPRVLVLTTFDLDRYVYDALRAGASRLPRQGRPTGTARRGGARGRGRRRSCSRRRCCGAWSRPTCASRRTTPSDVLAPLTEREREVLRAMAGGLTNAEIAAALYLSPATVKTHVARILPKLGLRDRVQAVVLAYECGLVRRGSAPAPGRRP